MLPGSDGLPSTANSGANASLYTSDALTFMWLLSSTVTAGKKTDN